MGSLAVEGPVIGWVSDHRKHHAHADEEGDPHSPHVDHDGETPGPLRGLWHAHVGWLFNHATAVDAAEVRAGPRRGPRHALHPQALPALGDARPAGPGGHRLARRRQPEERDHGLLLGRPDPGLHRPPHDLLDQLDLPLLRAAPLRDRRQVDERLLARRADLRRVLAPQPPRLPALGDARPALVGGRPRRPGDPRDEARRPRLERGADLARAPGAAEAPGRAEAAPDGARPRAS